MYNKALIVYKDARAIDSLSYIDGELKHWDETTIPDATDDKMRTLYNSEYFSLNSKFSRCELYEDHSKLIVTSLILHVVRKMKYKLLLKLFCLMIHCHIPGTLAVLVAKQPTGE